MNTFFRSFCCLDTVHYHENFDIHSQKIDLENMFL